MQRTILAILVLVIAAAAVPSAAQRTIDVVYDDGRARDRMEVYRLQDGDGWFLRANDVARLFKATQFWNASSRKVVLGVGRSRFILTVDTRVVVIDGEPVMMRTPTGYDAGFVMVPLEFILEVASHYTARTFLWDQDEMTLRVQGVGFNVESIEIAAEKDRTTATIGLAEPLLYHMDTSTAGIVRLKLYGGRVESRRFTIREPRGLIEGVRAEQTERDAFLYFDVSRETKRLRVERNESPQQLVVILEKGELPEIPEPGFEGAVEIVEGTAAERRTFEIATVVIDPGHGGMDYGKVGASGMLEKDVNLALARAMKERIEDELGLEVILTRDSDELLALRRRTEIANEAGGDLFISIHCNSWFSERTGGFEAYFLSPARSESERALARYENTSGSLEADEVPPARTAGGGDVDFILWDLVQNQFINESSTFAEFIQKAMEDRLAIRNRGVKQANFVVLQGARMPAVLVETAFLSNPAEEALLSDPDFHRRVADGLVEAIGRLRERYRR